jgi:hypothetical protein
MILQIMTIWDNLRAYLSNFWLVCLQLSILATTAPFAFSCEDGNPDPSVAAERKPMAYGPFESAPLFAHSALGGEASFWVPGRMRVSGRRTGEEFSLLKFILIESPDESVKGLEDGLVQMGGLMAFSVEPVNLPPDPSRRASIIWKGIQIALPGFEQRPKLLQGEGEIGTAWNLNLLLEQESFDTMWRERHRDNGERSKAISQVPKMKCFFIYRDYVEIEPEVRGQWTASWQKFRDEFAKLEEARGGAVVLNLKEGTSSLIQDLQMNEAIVHQGDLQSETSTRRVARSVEEGLFQLVRENWLDYHLEALEGSTKARIVLRLRDGAKDSPRELVFPQSRSRWVPIERYSETRIEVASGEVRGREVKDGFLSNRETRLNLEVWTWGDWTGTGIASVRVDVEAFRQGAAKPYRSTWVDVPVPRNSESVDITETPVTSADKEDIQLRFRVRGYRMSTPSGANGKFLLNPGDRKWSEKTTASLRSHVFYLCPEMVMPDTQLQKLPGQPTTDDATKIGD